MSSVAVCTCAVTRFMVSSKRACRAAMASWWRFSWAAIASSHACCLASRACRYIRSLSAIASWCCLSASALASAHCRLPSSLASFSRRSASVLSCSACSRDAALSSSTWRCHAEDVASACFCTFSTCACSTSFLVSSSCLLLRTIRLPMIPPTMRPMTVAMMISIRLCFMSDYTFTSHFSMFLRLLLKLIPTLYSLRVSVAKGRAYRLSSICCKASSAVPSSLNSMT